MIDAFVIRRGPDEDAVKIVVEGIAFFDAIIRGGLEIDAVGVVRCIGF